MILSSNELILYAANSSPHKVIQVAQRTTIAQVYSMCQGQISFKKQKQQQQHQQKTTKYKP